MKCKYMVFCLFLLCVSLLACSRQQSDFSPSQAPLHFNELDAIAGQLETQPELALDNLNALKAKVGTENVSLLDRNELALREIQAKYKNRCLSATDPDLAPVVGFYDSLAAKYPDNPNLHFLRANAYYYKGVQCAFANDDMEAFRHYLKALDVMLQRNDWSEITNAQRFTALSYTRLSELLYRYGLANAAFETCREAMSYYVADSDLAAMHRFEAAIYQSQRQYDKALACYQEAEKLVPIGDEPLQLVLGAKFFDLQQYDSAAPHLVEAFRAGDRFARVDAAAKLAEIYRDKGMADEELAYTRFYVENSMLETRLASRKMEMEFRYEDFKHSESASEQTREDNHTVLVVLALLLCALLFMAYIIVRNRKRISHIESKITTIEQKHEQENADKDSELEQMAQQLNDTREQLLANRPGFDEAWKTFSDSDIVRKIRHSVEGKDIMIKSVGIYPKLKLKEMDYIGLVQEANRCFPGFSSRFLKDYPDLNTTDLRHSCLGILGMNDAEIAVLEGISYSGANRRTNKILSVVGLGDNLEQALIDYLKRIM